jgi:hypothetical protein
VTKVARVTRVEEVEEVREALSHCEPSLARRGNPRLRYILEIASSLRSSQ